MGRDPPKQRARISDVRSVIEEQRCAHDGELDHGSCGRDGAGESHEITSYRIHYADYVDLLVDHSIPGAERSQAPVEPFTTWHHIERRRSC